MSIKLIIGQRCFFRHAFKPLFFAQIEMLAWFSIVFRRRAWNKVSDLELYNAVKILERRTNMKQVKLDKRVGQID